MVNFRSALQRQELKEHPPLSRHQIEWIAVSLGLVVLVCSLIVLVVHEHAHARDVARMATMSALGDQLNYYGMMFGHYPIANGVLGVNDFQCLGADGFHTGARYDECVTIAGIGWMDRDPQPGYAYRYRSIDNGTDFEVLFTLERSFMDLAAGSHRLTSRGIE